MGVMGESATAMRDPLFYRWHAFVNHMFNAYKHTLPPYEEKQVRRRADQKNFVKLHIIILPGYFSSISKLIFDNVRITRVQLKTDGVPNDNEISTFWQQADIDLSRGLDFADNKGSVYARVTHLQHAPFQYNITVSNFEIDRSLFLQIFIPS